MMVRVLLEPPRSNRRSKKSGPVDWVRRSLLGIAAVALGIVGYVYVDSEVYQRYEEWRFLQQPATVKPPTDAAREKPARSNDPLIGRIEIPRLGVHAMVREGVDDGTLRHAVGHVPGTARPGEDGNVAVAAHRDSFFRPLQGIRQDDRIFLETADSRYEYSVDSTRVVSPTDVSVLKPTKDPELTLITCYPFYYVGNAPKRFIVRARQVSVEARNGALNGSRSGS